MTTFSREFDFQRHVEILADEHGWEIRHIPDGAYEASAYARAYIPAAAFQEIQHPAENIVQVHGAGLGPASSRLQRGKNPGELFPADVAGVRMRHDHPALVLVSTQYTTEIVNRL